MLEVFCRNPGTAVEADTCARWGVGALFTVGSS